MKFAPILLLLFIAACSSINPTEPEAEITLASIASLAPPAPLTEDEVAELRAEIVNLKEEIAILRGLVYGATIDTVDINTAGIEELDTLPGVGPSTASAIIAHRASIHGFTSVEQLLDVRGIGGAKLSKIKPLATCSGAWNPDNDPEPELPAEKVNVNTAGNILLESLPGIGPAYAQRIIDYRNDYGAFASLDDLDAVKGIGPATIEGLRNYAEV